MVQVNENIFQDFCSISKQVQSIQQTVEKKSISPELRVQLHRELEKAQDSLETLRQKAMHTHNQANNQFMQLDEIENQIISLYHGVEEHFEEFEISLISKGALLLGSLLELGNMEKIALKIDTLKQNIHFLFQNRRPSLQHRKIIALALKLAEYADVMRGSPHHKDLKMVQLFKMLLMEALQKAEIFMDPAEGELAMEIYEIADLLFHQRKNEGLLKLNLIKNKFTKAQNMRIENAKNSEDDLIEALLQIADGDPCIQYGQDSFESVIHQLHA